MSKWQHCIFNSRTLHSVKMLHVVRLHSPDGSCVPPQATDKVNVRHSADCYSAKIGQTREF